MKTKNRTGLPGGYVREVTDHLERTENACDYCGQDSAHIMQGETDSFGFEKLYVCEECFQDWDYTSKSTLKGDCERCGAKNVETRPHSPWDEPSIVKHVCDSCAGKYAREAREAFRDDDDFEPDYEDPDEEGVLV